MVVQKYADDSHCGDGLAFLLAIEGQAQHNASDIAKEEGGEQQTSAQQKRFKAKDITTGKIGTTSYPVGVCLKEPEEDGYYKVLCYDASTIDAKDGVRVRGSFSAIFFARFRP